jgi:autotransporter-associated beta strand protein
MTPTISPRALACALALLACIPASAQRQVERLGRGVVAVRTNSTQIYVGWRLLGNDPSDIAFNLYRSANGGTPVKLNASPLSATTDYLDTPPNLSTTTYAWSVKPVIGGLEVPDTWAHPLSAAAALPANPPTRQYLPVPLQPTPDGALDVKFCWVGDLDGNGEFDFVVDRQSGEGFRQFLEAYKRDGTLLWRIDLGPNSFYKYNIEPGSSTVSIGHGDNVTVYDMDGDGRAEVLLRTANGVVFGNGATLTGGASNNVQFLSVVDGLSGAELARATIPNPRLGDGPMNGHMGILHLDGLKPSVLWAAKNRDSSNAFHGVVTTWDWRGGSLTQRWSWIDDGSLHAPEGHQIRIADVDNDGKDEFVEIGFVIDDNGTQLFNIAEMVHGDRFHLTDIDPDRPGLENFIIQQNNGTGLATAIFDPGTGAMIKKWYAGGVVDVGRGLAADFDASVKGCEFFSTRPGIFDAKGNQIHAAQPFPGEAIWWDADLSREFVATVGSTAVSPAINKFNPANPANPSRIYTIYNETTPGTYQAYGGRPQFWGDILGDWREEYLCVATDNSELRIYTPKTLSTTRLYTLMHNPQYRAQTTTKGYVQASYVDYHLGTGMTPPPPPPIGDADLVWRGGPGGTTWDNGITTSWDDDGAAAPFAPGNAVRFDIGADATTPVALVDTLNPSSVTVRSPKDHTFDGSSGSLAGSMKLVKAGKGSLAISGSHSFTGTTTVWDGELELDGTLSHSPVTVWGGTFGGLPAAGLAGGRIAGTGTFSQAVTLGYRGAITPGSGMGHAGTLSFGNGLVAQDGSYFALDLSNNPATSDHIAITGNLTLSGKVGIVIKALGGTIPPGTYTLATYTGTLNGNASNFSVSVPPGTPHTLNAGSGAITLTIPVTRAPAAIVWRGSGAAWDLASSQNWLNGASPDLFVAGDTVSFDATGSASPTATLSGALPVGGISVHSATDYTFSGSGSISGPGGLTKSGGGTLTVDTSNDYTGATTITGGVLAVASLADGGTPSSIGAAGTAAGNLVVNGGTLRLTGSQTNTNRGLTLGASGGTLDVAVSGSSMQISGALTGPGRLVKSGPGTLILASTNNYGGGTTIAGGTIYLAGSNANRNALGSGPITLDSGTLTMANVQNNDVCNWNLIVPAGSTGRLNADGRCSLNGSLTGSGTFDYYSPYVRSDLKGNWSAFTGRINLATDADGSEMRVTNTFGFGTAALHIGAESYVYFNVSNTSPVLNIGELTGDATTGIGGGPSSGQTVTWRVGGRNTDATFAGSIVNGTGATAIIKNGTGRWTLTGASTHSGSTTVSAGTLRIDGSTTGSSVIVQSSAALGGGGTITGNVTFQSGSVLEHAALASAPLAVTGNLAFGTNAVVRPLTGIALSPGTYTLLTYTGSLTGSPALSWQAPPGSELSATFDLATPGVVTLTLAQPPGVVDLLWTGQSSAVWDTATVNWTDGSAPAAFANGSAVSFTDLGDATSPVSLALDLEPDSVVVDSTKAYILSGSGRITGAGSLIKKGSGSLRLTTAHAHVGGTRIEGGTLALGADSSNTASTVQHPGLSGGNCTSLGSGGVTVTNGGQLRFGGRAGNTVYTYTIANPLTLDLGDLVSRDGLQNLTGGVEVLAGGSKWTTTWNTKNLLVSSPLSGSGPIAIDDSSAGGSDTARGIVRISSGGNSYSGVLTVNGTSPGFQGGVLQVEHDTALAQATVITQNTSVPGIVFTTATPRLGALGGSGSFALPATSLSVGDNGASTVHGGGITGGGALIKEGGGTLTFTGAKSYTGPTSVNAGKLVVDGTLATSSLTLSPAATLAGGGSIAGGVDCPGTLDPVGTLTLGAGLVLSPGSRLLHQVGTSTDLVSITGDLTLAGTLDVTAGPGFGPGTYTLASYSGNLVDEAGLTLGPMPEGYDASLDTTTLGQVRLIVAAVLSPFEEWQIRHFGSTTHPDAAPTADPDGDGTDNQTEFLLDLDPKSGASSFKAGGTVTPGGFQITWPSAAGLSFEVQRSASLAAPWTPLSTVTGLGTYTDPAPPAGKAFYRILLLP